MKVFELMAALADMPAGADVYLEIPNVGDYDLLGAKLEDGADVVLCGEAANLDTLTELVSQKKGAC